MLRKNLQLAFRNLKKNKGTAAINILGLAVGISASIVIFLIVRYDFSFDKWEPDNQQIYRVYTQIGKEGSNNGINLLAPKEINKKITGVNNVAHICEAGFLNYAVINNDRQNKTFTKWGSTVFADEHYFQLFPYKWLAGSPEKLSQLNSIVLSASEVNKFFPSQNYNNVIGQVITFNDSVNLTIRGIVGDLKEHSDFKYKNFISLNTFIETPLKNSYGTNSWTSVNASSQCLLRIVKGADPVKINQQVKDLYLEHTKDFDKKYRQIGTLQPLSDIHFNTKIDGKVSKSSLVNLGVLALLLLMLAAINFINLSTAQSSLRAKEIGIRKTFGCNKKKIIHQFLTETFVLTVFATILALIMVPFLLYVFKGFVPEGLGVSEILSPAIILFIIIIMLILPILAGLYPAFVLTKFKPISVLKNQINNQGKSSSAGLRKVLTVSQFVIAQVFLIVVVVIGKQIHYMLNKDLGFKKDAIISFHIPDGFTAGKNSHKYVLYNELKQIRNINNVSISTGPPTRNGWNTTALSWLHDGEKENFDNVHTRSVDNNYLQLFGLQLMAGKNIQIDSSSKTGEVLINQTFMQAMGIQNPLKVIGQYIDNGDDSSRIVGVLKDFSTQNLHNPISPTVLFADNQSWGYMMSVSLDENQPETWPDIIATIGNRFKHLYPKIDFDYSFYDQSLKNLYESDMRLSTLLKWSTGLAILISCLGLLGLVSFMANQRTKEIGIRKVLGASVSSIIALLSKSLIRLVLLASAIAFPFAWYFSNKWLNDFAFKTSIGWLIFAICAASMLLIALLTLCLRTLQSAKANPINSLRDE